MDLERVAAELLQAGNNQTGVLFILFVSAGFMFIYAGRQFYHSQKLTADTFKTFASTQQRGVDNQAALLESIKNLAMQQSARRDDTQTMLNTVQVELTKTIEDRAVKAQEVRDLRGDIIEYKEAAQKHISLITSQLSEAGLREDDMKQQIEALTEHNKQLIEQNKQLIDMIKLRDLEHKALTQKQNDTIDSLREQVTALQAQYAQRELETARIIAKLQARFDLLEDTGDKQNERHNTGNEQQSA